jgi:hypothetical protein
MVKYSEAAGMETCPTSCDYVGRASGVHTRRRLTCFENPRASMETRPTSCGHVDQLSIADDFCLASGDSKKILLPS